MTIGEAIALMCKFNSCTGDDLLLCKESYQISINDDSIEIYFTDANTPDYHLYKDGKREYIR